MTSNPRIARSSAAKLHLTKAATPLLLPLLLALGSNSTYGDTINGTGWKGTAGNSNWSSTGNWDSTAPNTSGTGDRNLFFGQGYANAGGGGSTTANNDLSGWHGYRMTFQDIGSDTSGANDKSFTITGNSFTLFDFGGNFPRIENDSYVTQTFTLTSGQVLGLDGLNGGQKAEINPVNGNIIFSAGTRIDIPTTNQLQIYGNNGNTVTFNGPISSSGNNNGNSVAINQNSTVIFAATNVYGGDTYINAGTLRCAANNAVTNTTFIRLGDSTLTATAGANLNLDGGFTEAAKINVRFGSSGALIIANTAGTSGTATYSGNIFLDTNVTLFANSSGSVTLSGTTLDLKNQTLTVDGAGAATISGSLTNSTGTGKLTKNGAGTLTLSGANAYSGGTTLSAGQLNINNPTALGTGAFTISGGIIDNTSGSSKTLTNAQNWNVDFTFIGSSDLSFSTGSVTPNANRKITVNGGNFTVNGIVGGGAVSLTKAGIGTLVLGGNNTFSGGATISQGRITWNSNAGLGGTSGSPGTGGTVTLNDANTSASDTPSLLSSQAGTLPNNITVANAGSGNAAVIGNDSGNVSVSYSGTLTLNKPVSLRNGSSSGTATFSGKVTGAGAPTIIGGGIVRFASTANDFTSDVTISSGMLRLNASGVIPDGSGKGTVTLAPTSPNSATFDVGGFDETINGLTSSGTGSSVVDNSSATAKTLTIGTAGSNPDGTFAGIIQNSGGTASLAIAKAGAGKLTLTGKNTYGGGTTVSGGTLLVNGGSTSDSSSGTGSGAVSVSSGATLGGTGRIGGNVTFSSGAFALFTNGAALTIAGTLTLNGNVVHLTIPANVGPGTYTLATYTASGSSGSFANTPIPDSGSFASGTTNFITTSGGVVSLVVQNVTTTVLTRTSGNSPSTYGDSLTYHAVVSPDPGNGATISFRTNGVQFGTAATASGAADLTTSTLPYSGGSAYAVTAVFTGSATYAGSSGTLSGGQQVNQRSLNITANDDTKTYGQTKTYGAGQTAFSSSGLQNSETIGSVSIAASGGTAATDGTNSYSLTPSSATGGTFKAVNYSITYNNGTLTVNPLAVSLSGSRTYDGTTNAAAGILSIANIVNSDNVNVASGTAGLASANVGSQAITSIGTLTLGGTRATNYTVTGASGSVLITALAVNLTGTRAYDGTTNAAAAILSVANAVGADTVNVASGAGGLASKNAGTQAISSFGTLALGNNSAGNYTLSGASGSVVITQAVTSVSVSSSENPSGYKDSISFTASLPADATGNVVFKTNTVSLSTNVLSTGTATSASTVALSRGTNVVTVEYAGDPNYLGSTNNLSSGQVVTNHPPAAATMFVQRSAGLTLKIALADIVTNWSDFDDDSVALASLNLVTTNNINLTTNSTWILYTNSPNVNDQISYTIADGQGGTNTGLINIAIVTTVTGTNSISSIVNNGTSVSLVAYGIPDLTYVTQRSTNLADWVSIATNVAATNGAISVTDNFTDLPRPPESAYYRLSWTP